MKEHKRGEMRNVGQLVEMGRCGTYTLIGRGEDLTFRADGNKEGHPVAVRLITPGHEWLLMEGDGSYSIGGLIEWLQSVKKADEDHDHDEPAEKEERRNRK